MDQDGSRTGDGENPTSPEQEPSQDSGHGRPKRDSPAGGVVPVGERNIHTPIHYRSRVTSSLGAEDAKLIERYIPIRIYLADGRTAAVVERSVSRLLTALKVSVESSSEPEIGSWFRMLLGKTQEPTTGSELRETLTHGARLVQLNSPDGDGAAITISEAAAAAELIRSLNGEPSAAIQIGSILIVKCRSREGDASLVVKTLTKRQMLYIEDNTDILKTPSLLLETIRALERSDVATAPLAEFDATPREVTSTSERGDIPRN
jgi:hypothetical protein